MKKCFVLLSMFIWVSCASQQQFISKDNAMSYKIKKIENSHTLYFIYAQRNDTLFQIISLMDTVSSDFEAIKTGNKYQLDLIKIYPNDLLRIGYNGARQNAKGSVFFCTDKKTHYSLYVATNLSGLNILDSQQSIENIIDRFCYVEIMPNHVRTKRNFRNILRSNKKVINMILYIKDLPISEI